MATFVCTGVDNSDGGASSSGNDDGAGDSGASAAGSVVVADEDDGGQAASDSALSAMAERALSKLERDARRCQAKLGKVLDLWEDVERRRRNMIDQ